jgi:hypothetical protein
MRSVHNASDAATLERRLCTLTPETPGLWGRMSAPQMVCHVRDQISCAIGDLPVRPRKNFLRNRYLRFVLVYLLPWPKGKLPTVSEMQTSKPSNWDEDVRLTTETLRRAAAHDVDGEWADHPAFGRLSGKEWGQLIYKHMDHHLRQFGV